MILTRLQRWPIATRILVSAMLLVLLVLPAAGALLAWNVRQTMEASFNNRLESLLNVIIAGVAYNPQTDALDFDRQLGDPRFERVFSGWYWQIHDGGARVITSRSLWDQRLPLSDIRGLHFRPADGPRSQAVRVAERTVQLPNLDNSVHLAVAADVAELEKEVARFQTLLVISLATLGVLLLALTGLQIRWGLAPLRRVERSLKAVEAGQRHTLDTDLPEELARLARTINLVLERDQRLIERGRTAAGNLAHALKTPVAVLATLAERLPNQQQAAMQTELRRLDEAVRHHLARASAAGPVVLGAEQELATVLAPVVSGIERLATRRGLRFSQHIPAGVRVRVDPQDLQEVAGNLLENAVNWAESSIILDIECEPERIRLRVADDGPGMTATDRDAALRRGGRLDQARSGSGLGLAIVAELVQLYGGELELGSAPQGGLLAEVSLPRS